MKIGKRSNWYLRAKVTCMYNSPKRSLHRWPDNLACYRVVDKAQRSHIQVELSHLTAAWPRDIWINTCLETRIWSLSVCQLWKRSNVFFPPVKCFNIAVSWLPPCLNSHSHAASAFGMHCQGIFVFICTLPTMRDFSFKQLQFLTCFNFQDWGRRCHSCFVLVCGCVV